MLCILYTKDVFDFFFQPIVCEKKNWNSNKELIKKNKKVETNSIELLPYMTLSKKINITGILINLVATISLLQHIYGYNEIYLEYIIISHTIASECIVESITSIIDITRRFSNCFESV